MLPPLVALDEEEEEDEEEGAFCVTVLRKGGRGEGMMRRRDWDRDGKEGFVHAHKLKHGWDMPLAARPSARVDERAQEGGEEEGRRTEGGGRGEEKWSLYVPPGTSRTVKRAVACTEKRLSTDMMGCVCVRVCVCWCERDGRWRMERRRKQRHDDEGARRGKSTKTQASPAAKRSAVRWHH